MGRFLPTILPRWSIFFSLPRAVTRLKKAMFSRSSVTIHADVFTEEADTPRARAVRADGLRPRRDRLLSSKHNARPLPVLLIAVRPAELFLVAELRFVRLGGVFSAEQRLPRYAAEARWMPPRLFSLLFSVGHPSPCRCPPILGRRRGKSKPLYLGDRKT